MAKRRRPRRHRGEGSVYQSEGSWIAAFPLGVSNGRRRFKRARCRTEEDAFRELERMRNAYGAGVEPALMTLDAYLDDWLANVRPTIAAATFTSYSGHARLHIRPLLGGMVVSRIRPADVRRLIADRLAVGLSPATVRRVVTTLHMALGQAVRERALSTNPAANLRLPLAPRHEIRAMTWEDADRIVAAVRGDSFEALYVLLLFTGMRVGEATGLDWRDVDLEGRRLFVRRGKTHASARVVPLAQLAYEAMVAHQAVSVSIDPADPVFVGPRRGQRLRVDVVTHHFPRLLEAAGLPRMRVHDLRHGTATLLLSLGVPSRDIADLLGHATPSVTMNVYMHVTERMQREAVDRLDRRGLRAIDSRNDSQTG
jgi:integrase